MGIAKEDVSQQEEQMRSDIKKILESIQPIIAQYVAFKANSDITNKIITKGLWELETRVKMIEDKLGFTDKVE